MVSTLGLKIMNYPQASNEHVEFFHEHGYLVVKDAIDLREIQLLDEACQEILRRKEELANDWAWEKGRTKEQRSFKIVQANPGNVVPNITELEFRRWTAAFASCLLGQPVAFWYDQYLAKPPLDGAETYWHQDEGYWGRNLDDKGITCWMPFHDVDETNGCMHFIDHGHRDGILIHTRPDHIKSDLLVCKPDASRTVICPIKCGDVTFHHGKTPHMTTPNLSNQWRQAITTHMSAQGATFGNFYPWYAGVNQRKPDKQLDAK